MLCYRDMTFCGFKNCTNFDTCCRALTEKVQFEAEAFGLPTSRYISPPPCHTETKTKEKKHHA